MFTPDKNALEDMMKPGREAFEFWVSFFPTAPLFGVEYRFGDMFGKMPTGQTMPWGFSAALKPAPKTAPAAPKKAPEPEAKAAPVAKTPAEPEAKKPAPAVAKSDTKTPAKTAAPDLAPTKPVEPAAAPKKPARAKATKGANGKPAALLSEKPEGVDDLKRIKGIGPGLEKELNGLGVYQFEQMAGFGKKELEWIDANLTAFKGRCFRDDWTGQAKALMN